MYLSTDLARQMRFELILWGAFTAVFLVGEWRIGLVTAAALTAIFVWIIRRHTRSALESGVPLDEFWRASHERVVNVDHPPERAIRQVDRAFSGRADVRRTQEPGTLTVKEGGYTVRVKVRAVPDAPRHVRVTTTARRSADPLDCGASWRVLCSVVAALSAKSSTEPGQT